MLSTCIEQIPLLSRGLRRTQLQLCIRAQPRGYRGGSAANNGSSKGDLTPLSQEERVIIKEFSGRGPLASGGRDLIRKKLCRKCLYRRMIGRGELGVIRDIVYDRSIFHLKKKTL